MRNTMLDVCPKCLCASPAREAPLAVAATQFDGTTLELFAQMLDEGGHE